MDSRYEVAYREALRAVDDQAKTVENIRTRAGTLFSAAGVTTAILGLALGDLGKDDDIARCGLRVGGAAFIVLAATTVAIWWPIRECDPGGSSRRWRGRHGRPAGRFNMEARLIIRDIIDTDHDVYLELALHHAEHAVHNRQIIRRLLRWHVGGLIAFAVLVVAFVIALLEVTT